ncbi:MAG TPA: DoxX family protein [Hyphomicrobiales bacterium]|nr:DoxX family protein [Kaistiaceae bacterium]HQF30459.1 DoxX family protein [Hyphomicrobiales bacterium]
MIDTRTAPYAALALRLGLGLMLLAHGLLKVFVFTVPGTVGFFGSLGLPAAFAYLTILGEIGGGLLILAGLRTRWIALAVLPILLGATVVHSGNGWLFTAEGGGWEYPAFLSLAAIVQALLGDGAYALSAYFDRRPTPQNA